MPHPITSSHPNDNNRCPFTGGSTAAEADPPEDVMTGPPGAVLAAAPPLGLYLGAGGAEGRAISVCVNLSISAVNFGLLQPFVIGCIEPKIRPPPNPTLTVVDRGSHPAIATPAVPTLLL